MTTSVIEITVREELILILMINQISLIKTFYLHYSIFLTIRESNKLRSINKKSFRKSEHILKVNSKTLADIESLVL